MAQKQILKRAVALGMTPGGRVVLLGETKANRASEMADLARGALAEGTMVEALVVRGGHTYWHKLGPRGLVAPEVPAGEVAAPDGAAAAEELGGAPGLEMVDGLARVARRPARPRNAPPLAGEGGDE